VRQPKRAAFYAFTALLGAAVALVERLAGRRR
jgi:hypothetical protein